MTTTLPPEIMTCRSCGAAIVWLGTKAGKSMPVNADTFAPGDTQYDGARHKSHFATCPQGNQWRRKR